MTLKLVEEGGIDSRVDVILEVDRLGVEFRTSQGPVVAADDVSFSVLRGESLGIVGESGSGKSTTARAILGLESRATGSVTYKGKNLLTLKQGEFRNLRADLQLIFQDPIASLNPRLTVQEIVAEGLRIWPDRQNGLSIAEQVDLMLAAVGLNPNEYRKRRPSELSGGQCQRVAIARALILEPEMLVCDESVSALDVSVQAQVLNLLREMRRQQGLSMIFISHDLAVVKNISDRVVVMYRGSLCEIADSDDIFHGALHPYTQLLIDSVPGVSSPSKRRVTEQPQVQRPDGAAGEPAPDGGGCRFSARCPLATERCLWEAPKLETRGEGHLVACHNV